MELRWIHSVARLFIYTPLRALYFNGPTTVGFWGGAQPHDICFSITGTTSSFWLDHVQECDRLCEQKFDAFAVFVIFGLYIAMLAKFVDAITIHICFTRPILGELRRAETGVAHTVYKQT